MAEQMSEHDRHTILEIRHNLPALDTESIVPWSRVPGPEGAYYKMQEALQLTIFAIEEADSEDKIKMLERVKAQLEGDLLSKEVADLVARGVKMSKSSNRMKWTRH